MRSLLIIVLTVVAFSACTAEKPDANKSNVYAWGTETYKNLADIYPASFQNMTKSALIPDDYDYSKRNLQFDPQSNMQVSLSLADKAFLRDAGIVSSIAEFCKLGWTEKNYLPIMQWQRLQVSPTEKNGLQVAIVGLIHGYAQGTTDDWLKTNDAKCDEAASILRGNLFADHF